MLRVYLLKKVFHLCVEMTLKMLRTLFCVNYATTSTEKSVKTVPIKYHTVYWYQYGITLFHSSQYPTLNYSGTIRIDTCYWESFVIVIYNRMKMYPCT